MMWLHRFQPAVKTKQNKTKNSPRNAVHQCGYVSISPEGFEGELNYHFPNVKVKYSVESNFLKVLVAKDSTEVENMCRLKVSPWKEIKILVDCFSDILIIQLKYRGYSILPTRSKCFLLIVTGNKGLLCFLRCHMFQEH